MTEPEPLANASLPPSAGSDASSTCSCTSPLCSSSSSASCSSSCSSCSSASPSTTSSRASSIASGASKVSTKEKEVQKNHYVARNHDASAHGDAKEKTEEKDKGKGFRFTNPHSQKKYIKSPFVDQIGQESIDVIREKLTKKEHGARAKHQQKKKKHRRECRYSEAEVEETMDAEKTEEFERAMEQLALSGYPSAAAHAPGENTQSSKQQELSISRPVASLASIAPSKSCEWMRLRLLIVSDVGASLRSVARLSKWLSTQKMEHQIDAILCTGLRSYSSNPPYAAMNYVLTQPSSVAEGNDDSSLISSELDSAKLFEWECSRQGYSMEVIAEGECSATIAALENICPRVIYTPGKGDPDVLYRSYYQPYIVPATRTEEDVDATGATQIQKSVVASSDKRNGALSVARDSCDATKSPDLPSSDQTIHENAQPSEKSIDSVCQGDCIAKGENKRLSVQQQNSANAAPRKSAPYGAPIYSKPARMTPHSFNVCARGIRFDPSLVVCDSLAFQNFNQFLNEEILVQKQQRLARDLILTYHQTRKLGMDLRFMPSSSLTFQYLFEALVLNAHSGLNDKSRTCRISWHPWGDFLWLNKRTDRCSISKHFPRQDDWVDRLPREGLKAEMDKQVSTEFLFHGNALESKVIENDLPHQRCIVIETYVSDSSRSRTIGEYPGNHGGIDTSGTGRDVESLLPNHGDSINALVRVVVDFSAGAAQRDPRILNYDSCAKEDDGSVVLDEKPNSLAAEQDALSWPACSGDPVVSETDGAMCETSLVDSPAGWTNLVIDPGALREGSFALVDLGRPCRASSCKHCQRINHVGANSPSSASSAANPTSPRMTAARSLSCCCWRVTQASVHRI